MAYATGYIHNTLDAHDFDYLDRRGNKRERIAKIQIGFPGKIPESDLSLTDK